MPVGSDGTEIAGVLGEVQANPTANTLLGRLKALETAFATLNAEDFATETTLALAKAVLDTILAKLSTDPLPAGDNNIGNVDVVTMPNVIVGSSALPTGAATSAKQDALAALVGSVSDAAVTDPTLSGSEIALLKGLLKQMQGNGTGTLPVNVSGGVVISGDTTLAGTVLMRDATDPAKLAKVDANGNQLVTVSGSKSQQKESITLVNAAAITDTTGYYADPATGNLSATAKYMSTYNNYNRHVLEVINSHDRDITLSIVNNLRGSGYDVITHSVSKTNQRVVIPASGATIPIIIDGSILPVLNQLFISNIGITVKAGTAPTSGSITVKLTQWSE